MSQPFLTIQTVLQSIPAALGVGVIPEAAVISEAAVVSEAAAVSAAGVDQVAPTEWHNQTILCGIELIDGSQRT